MTEPSQDKLMPTEEMIEAGIGKAGEIQNAATSAEFVTAIYNAMEAARPTTDVSTDVLVERMARIIQTADTLWLGSELDTIAEAKRRIEALQRSNAELVARVTGALNLLLDGQIQSAKNAFREALSHSSETDND